MAELNRRDFMKVVGVSSAAGVVACDPMLPAEQLYPYVVPPEEIIPGLPTFLSTVCSGCSASCGMVARHREGRVVNLQGNPDNPTGEGKLCARGQAGLQDTYDPDRTTSPSGSWEETIAAAAGRVAEDPAGVRWWGRYRTGSLQKLIADFATATGGKAIHHEPMGYESLIKASQLAFGRSVAPAYRLDDVQTIVSFGADFLHTWLSPVAHTRGWARARDAHHGGTIAQFFALEPRVSNTSAMADTWWASRPGTEAGIARALTKLVAEIKGHDAATAWLSGVDPAAEAAAAGIDLGKLEQLATQLAGGPSVIFPGGVGTAGGDSTELALATLVLNEVCGNVGHSVLLTAHNHLGPVHSAADVEALLAECSSGAVSTLFLDELDPVFSLPADAGVGDALAKVGQVYVLGSRQPEGLPDSAILLPVNSTLESWGDAEGRVGFHGLQQPTMAALHDTRSTGNILLAIAKGAGLQASAPGDELSAESGEDSQVEKGPVMVDGQEAVANFAAVDFYRYVAGRWHSEIHSEDDGPFANWWTQCLRQGGHFEAPAETPAPLASGLPEPSLLQPVRDAHALLLFPHPFLHDGRHAHKPWMQEIPEPLSGYTWGTWAEISEKTAQSLGVDAKSTVEVRTEHGTLNAGVRISKGMRDDTVAVVVGNGHKAGGRYSNGWGANAAHLLSFAQKDARSGALNYLGQTARLSAGEADNSMYSLKGSEDMDDRPVALNSAATAVLGGAGLAPGELAPEHHIPKDPRITGEGAYNMYPEPEHPNFRFGMSVDLDSCTGCGACEAACISENNIPMVGPRQHRLNRYMGWIRLDRFWEGEGEHPDVRFIPVMCQHCSHAPCEGVCPVLATYHNLDGLNAMIYNRCVGTRYCANNCPYSARRFNYHTFMWPDAYSPMLNPDVSIREMGVMEKCSFCVQRIQGVKFEHRDQDIPDVALRRLPACAETCPADAIAFGDLKDESSEVYGTFQDPRAYTLFGELNTKPGVKYLTKVSFHESADAHHGGGSESEHGSDDDHPADDVHEGQGGH